MGLLFGDAGAEGAFGGCLVGGGAVGGGTGDGGGALGWGLDRLGGGWGGGWGGSWGGSGGVGVACVDGAWLGDRDVS